MKKVLALLGLAGMFLRGRAQSFAEWFEQNKTEKKYLREQLIALQELDEVLQEGYAVDENGLTRIGLDKKADLREHTEYFRLLRNVNPTIKADSRVGKILALTAESKKLIDRIRGAGSTFPRLKSRLDSLCNEMDEMCVTDLLSLSEILQDGYAALTDGERLAELGEVYADAKELNEIARDAWTDAQLFTSMQRLCESYYAFC
jgi:hypothetical protein